MSIMRCEYIDIVTGKRCKSNFASKKPYLLPESSKHVREGNIPPGEHFFCPAHAKKLGVYPVEREIQRRNSISDSRKGRRFDSDKRGLGVGNPLGVDSDLVPESLTDMTQEEAERIVSGMFCDEDFKLDSLVSELRDSGFDMKLCSVHEDCMVLWWLSDPKTRYPGNIKHCAYILGISITNMTSLVDSEAFRNKLNARRMLRMNRVIPIIEKRQLVKAVMGVKDSESWIKSVFKKLQLDSVGSDVTKGIDPAIIEKADSLIEGSEELDSDKISAQTYMEIINS